MTEDRGNRNWRDVVAVPGFGDTSAYWLATLGLDRPSTLALSWAGMWGVPPVAQPYSLVVAQIAVHGGDRIVVGHSLGARAACEAALFTPPAGLILLAPGIGSLPFLEDGALDRWAEAGERRTVRPNVDGEGLVEFSVPYSFAADLVNHGRTPVVDAEIRIVLFSDDEHVHPEAVHSYAARLPGGRAEVVEIDGPHRFWESDQAASEVAALTDSWMTALSG